MSITSQAILALAILVVGWLMSSWAAKYDVKSWFTDAVWRFILRQGWRSARENARPLPELDETLKRQLAEKAQEFKADSARLGRIRATAKHGAVFAIAYAVGLIATPIILVGLVVLGHALYRWYA